MRWPASRVVVALAIAAPLFSSVGASALEPIPSHVFPVPSPHSERGPIGDFGAPRSGGRIHEGFDINAKCGAKMVSVAAGKVIRRGFDPVLHGNYLLVKKKDEGRNYFYAHMVRPAVVGLHDEVQAGQRIGSVGDTGNAQSTGCHLHFEIRDHGKPIDPEPALHKWDRYS